jgi:RecB family endonuclease NucS
MYEKVKMVPIRSKDLEQDLGWLYTNPQGGMEAVRSYIIRHPAIVELGLEFLSVELYLAPKMQADLLFRKGNTYYVVEAKSKKFSEGEAEWQVLRYCEALIEVFGEKGVTFDAVIPVICYEQT